MENENLTIECSACGALVPMKTGQWAMDKHGDCLCHDCHIKAALMLKAQCGVDWQGTTFGYELSKVFRG